METDDDVAANNFSADDSKEYNSLPPKLESPTREGVSHKLRNPELSAIQDKNVSVMIQRIESISRLGDSPSSHQLSSSLLVAESPRLKLKEDKSVSEEVSESVVGDAASKESTARSGANRKVDIVIDSYEVQLEKR